MTEVKFFYHRKVLLGIEGRGHSGYASKGEDVVCAAVSTLLNSLLLGLIHAAKIKDIGTEINEKVPFMRITWSEEHVKKIFILTKTIELSLKQVAEENPEYVKISEVFLE